MEQPRTRVTSSSINFPRWLLSAVFCRLPIESIITCKCVCKSWNRLIKDQDFARDHLRENTGPTRLIIQPYWPHHNRAVDGPVDSHFRMLDVESHRSWRIQVEEFDVSELLVMGTCDGLVVMASPVSLDPIYVCNPVTRDTMRLPILWRKSVQHNHRVGLGFDRSTQQYRVLRTYVENGVRSFESVVVGNEPWKKIKAPYQTLGSCRITGPTFWRGAIHWKVRPGLPDIGLWILAFGVGDEKFQTIPMPSNDKFDFEMVVLGGSLTVIEHANEIMRIFKMEGDRAGEFELKFVEEHDTHVLWNRYHYYDVIDRPGCNSGGDGDEEESYLFQITAYYGTKSNRREHFTQFFPKLATYSYRAITGLPQNFRTVCGFKPSLVSPRG